MNTPSRQLLVSAAIVLGAWSLAACDRRPADPQLPSDPARTTPTPSTSPNDVAPPLPPASAASQ